MHTNGESELGEDDDDLDARHWLLDAAIAAVAIACLVAGAVHYLQPEPVEIAIAE